MRILKLKNFMAGAHLLDHKADVNAKDEKGRTPLSLSKRHNRGRTIVTRKDIGDLLRKYGAKD